MALYSGYPSQKGISCAFAHKFLTNSFKKYLLKSVLGQVSTKGNCVPSFVLGIRRKSTFRKTQWYTNADPLCMLTNLLQEWAGQVVIQSIGIKFFLPIRLKCNIRYYLGLIVENAPRIVANLWLIFRVLKKLDGQLLLWLLLFLFKCRFSRSLLHHFAIPFLLWF